MDIGLGASGAPMIVGHNTRNLGYLYSNYASYSKSRDVSSGPRYDPEEFNNLLDHVSNN